MIRIKRKICIVFLFQFLILIFITDSASAWFGKTHLAIAKVADYKNWYNAAAADIAKLKTGDIEQFNHFVNNRKGTTITTAFI